MDKNKCCGTCKHHVNQDGDWTCLCPDSEEFTDCTDYNYCCEEWEDREWEK